VRVLQEAVSPSLMLGQPRHLLYAQQQALHQVRAWVGAWVWVCLWVCPLFLPWLTACSSSSSPNSAFHCAWAQPHLLALAVKYKNYCACGIRLSSMQASSAHTRTRVQDAVLLDPYAQAVLSRRHWGKLAPDHDWEAPGMLGFAATWPQAAGALPSQDVFDWEGEVVP
jgi:hypothetical protein